MDKPTIDTYNKKAREYDESVSDFWEKKFPHSFLNLFVTLSGKEVLNVGSGSGRDGLLLQNAGKNVVCVDASEEMVKMSTDRGLTSVVGDFLKLPFPDASFDAVWAYTSLLHVPKSEIGAALGEISRVLKEDGILGLGLIEGESEGHEKMGDDATRWFSYYKEWEVQHIARQHGFSPIYLASFQPGPKNFLNFVFRKAHTAEGKIEEKAV